MSNHDRTDELTALDATADRGAVPAYEIRVRGHLGARWAAWFDGLALSQEDDGTTVLRGPVVDQAALHGLLQKLRDLGVTLLSLTTTSDDATATTGPLCRPDRPNQPGAPS